MMLPANLAIMDDSKTADTTPVSVTLYQDSKKRLTIDEKSYTLSGTNALSALLTVAEENNYHYQISDEFYNVFDSFLVTSLMDIENVGMDGWQYWVNYPIDDIPMVGANNYELENGDMVSWFYSVFDENKTNPDTSDHVINIDITIESDEQKPNISFLKPSKGAIYFNDTQLFTIPFISSSIIINPITITVDANDKESGLSNVTFAVDDAIQNSVFKAPFHWEYVPDVGLNKVTLTVTATDRSNNQQVIQKQLLTLN